MRVPTFLQPRLHLRSHTPHPPTLRGVSPSTNITCTPSTPSPIPLNAPSHPPAAHSISDFESSFAKGKLLNNSLGFSLFVAVPDIKAFRKDPTKTGKCIGNTTADNITDPTGQGGHVPTGDTTSHAATIRIFDGGVLPTHELRMEYTLPFTGADGVEY